MYISKFNALANNIISEARQSSLEYEEKRAKDKIDEVVVKVTGEVAAKLTKLGETITEVRALKDEYDAKNKELTAEAKEYASQFFDEADQITTRCIDTDKLIIKLTKVVPKITKEEKKDADKLEATVKEIAALLVGQQNALAKQIKALIDNCDYLSTIEKKTVPVQKVLVSEPKVVTESVKDVVDKIAKKIKGFCEKIAEFLTGFDEKQEVIKEKLAAI